MHYSSRNNGTLALHKTSHRHIICSSIACAFLHCCAGLLRQLYIAVLRCTYSTGLANLYALQRFTIDAVQLVMGIVRTPNMTEKFQFKFEHIFFFAVSSNMR